MKGCETTYFVHPAWIQQFFKEIKFGIIKPYRPFYLPHRLANQGHSLTSPSSSFWSTPVTRQSELIGSVAAFGSWNPSFFWFPLVIGQSKLNGIVANLSFFLIKAGNRAKWNEQECSSILLLKPILLLVHAGYWTEWIEWECSWLLLLKPNFLPVNAGDKTVWTDRECSRLLFLKLLFFDHVGIEKPPGRHSTVWECSGIWLLKPIFLYAGDMT